ARIERATSESVRSAPSERAVEGVEGRPGGGEDGVAVGGNAIAPLATCRRLQRHRDGSRTSIGHPSPPRGLERSREAEGLQRVEGGADRGRRLVLVVPPADRAAVAEGG